MKNYIAILVTLFSTIICNGQVRKTKWGMNKQQVIATEDLKPSMNNQTGLAYNVNLAGLDNYLFYFFNPDGKLAAAAYNLSEKYASDNSYLSAYIDLLAKLKEKYGEGVPDIKWSNDLYKDDKQKWGLAIAAEHLTIANRWETDDTYIVAEISGKNYETTVAIRYTSKNIVYKQKKNELDDF